MNDPYCHVGFRICSTASHALKPCNVQLAVDYPLQRVVKDRLCCFNPTVLRVYPYKLITLFESVLLGRTKKQIQRQLKILILVLQK